MDSKNYPYWSAVWDLKWKQILTTTSKTWRHLRSCPKQCIIHFVSIHLVNLRLHQTLLRLKTTETKHRCFLFQVDHPEHATCTNMKGFKTKKIKEKESTLDPSLELEACARNTHKDDSVIYIFHKNVEHFCNSYRVRHDSS